MPRNRHSSMGCGKASRRDGASCLWYFRGVDPAQWRTWPLHDPDRWHKRATQANHGISQPQALPSSPR
jgi:hypothetical protein